MKFVQEPYGPAAPFTPGNGLHKMSRAGKRGSTQACTRMKKRKHAV